MAAQPALDRYSRQTLFGPVGKQGQERLRASSVAIIGCGALGATLANNLCRAGIGRLVIADRDYIELNNLQRQILFDEDDITRRLPKAIAAAEKLRRINSDVIASYGVTMNILPGDTPCLRCIFPEMPQPGTSPTCDTAGVLNGIVGAITGVASTEAMKILLKDEKVSRAMFWMDVWENTSERIELPRQPDCPACGQHQYEFLDSLSAASSTSLCGRNAVQVRTGIHGASLDLPGLAERLQAVGQVSYNEYLLRFVVDGYELTVFPDARAIIKGTDDAQVARSVYARYVGM